MILFGRLYRTLEMVAKRAFKSARPDSVFGQWQIQRSDVWFPLSIRALLIVIVGIALAPCLIAQGKDSLTIELDPSIGPESVHVNYFLRGGFGGGGGDYTDRTQASPHEVVLPMYQNGQRGTSLKAVVYAKGCALATFALDPLPPGPGRVRSECLKLRTVTLKGMVTGYPRPSELTVRLRYMANWSHIFFGISDGAVLSFPIAEIVPDADGKFAVAVPDFANDAVANSYKRQADWLITAWRTGTNDQYWLNTDDQQQKSPGRLAIERQYPKELRFVAKQF